MKTLFIVLGSLLVLNSIGYMTVSLPQFGKHPEGERLARIEKSPNYKDGSFQNLSPTVLMAEEASYWKMLGWYTWNKQQTTPTKPIAVVKRDLKTYLSPEHKPIITWFGHSSYLIQYKGKNILVDPVFCGYASPFKNIGAKAYKATSDYRLEDLPPIDLVILTHDHYDHLDYHSIIFFKDKVKKFVMPLGVGAHLSYWGVPEANITELDWWEETQPLASFRLICTPARHFSGRGFKRAKTLWASYVLKVEDYTLFLGGDSGYGTHFKLIGQEYGPFDLAILECGQYNAYWKYIHMLPHEIPEAARDLQTKVLLPVHWAKFTLSVHPWDEPIKQLIHHAEKYNQKIITPQIGELVALDSILPQRAWWLD